MAEYDAAGSRRWRCDPDLEHHRLSAAAGDDHFDDLPDPLLLVIFNRIGDVKALGRCALVSRRFHALVPLVDSVLVRVDCVIPDDPASASSSGSPSAPSSPTASARARNVFSQIARMVIGGIVKPIQALGQILSHANSASDFPASASLSSFRRSSSSSTSPSSPPPGGDVSHHSPSEVLRSFKELRSLRIELPAGELGMDEGVLLKWKADFGSTLGSCVILGAASASPASAANDCASTPPAADCGESDDSGSIPESFYTNGGLKLRVLWTISSLIAASARHYLLQPIISDHAMLETLDLIDADGQGVLTMDKCQLQELRVRPVSASGDSHRTLMPALSMRLWYAPHIELPGGTVLNGATLVAIKPSEEAMRDTVGNGAAGSAGGSWVSDAFEEPYRTAVRMLLKRRMYTLEMNSF